MDANVAGMRVKVTTSLGETVQGEIFTYDSNTNCVVLEEFIPQTQKKNIRIMKAALLKDVQVLSTPQSRGEQPGHLQKLPAVELGKVVALEQHAMAQAADLRRLIGKGVSEEAQDLFDALNKTLPCDWNGQTIIVGVVGQNEVIVTPPYTPESASGNDAKSLAHVRKVLTGERTKLPK